MCCVGQRQRMCFCVVQMRLQPLILWGAVLCEGLGLGFGVIPQPLAVLTVC
jgi:hypothetical protein